MQIMAIYTKKQSKVKKTTCYWQNLIFGIYSFRYLKYPKKIKNKNNLKMVKGLKVLHDLKILHRDLKVIKIKYVTI